MYAKSPMHTKGLIYLVACCTILLLSGCASQSRAPEHSSIAMSKRPTVSERGLEVTLFALGLIDTGYRFGGKNPEAGLDCSGMVSYIFGQAAGLKVSGSAADIARKGRAVDRERLRPGDLVFFNTRNAAFSHVGIYIGDERFVHAPKTNGRVRIEQMSNRYFAQRFEAARSYFD
jgi:cell wall-associated NlpC family hydrolase